MTAKPAPDAFPGWPRVEAELIACINVGDKATLSAPDAMVVLGEMARVKGRLDDAVKVLRRVQDGDGCFGSEQGYAPCAFRGVQQLLDGAPKRRWWRRRDVPESG